MYFVNDPTIRGTRTGEAFRVATDDVFTSLNGDRTSVDDVIVLLSDGRSNIDTAQTTAQAQRAKNSGIRVISIVIGQDVGMAEMEEVASTPEEDNVFVLNDVSNIDDVASDVLDLLCSL